MSSKRQPNRNIIQRIAAATHVYVGYKSCGCMVAVVTDTQDKDTANSVADFIKSGLTIMRLSLEEYRKGPFPMGCKCPKPVQGSLIDGAVTETGIKP